MGDNIADRDSGDHRLSGVAGCEDRVALTDHPHHVRARIFKRHVEQGYTFQQIADMEGMSRGAIGGCVRLWRRKLVEAEGVIGSMGWSILRE